MNVGKYWPKKNIILHEIASAVDILWGTINYQYSYNNLFIVKQNFKMMRTSF